MNRQTLGRRLRQLTARRRARALSVLYGASRSRYVKLRAALGKDSDQTLTCAYIRLSVRSESLLRSEESRFSWGTNLLSLPVALCMLASIVAVFSSLNAGVSIASAIVAMLILVLAFGYMAPRTDSLWRMLVPSATLSALLAAVWATASIKAPGEVLAAERSLPREIATGATAGSALTFCLLAAMLALAYMMLRWAEAWTRSHPDVDAFITAQKLSEWVTGSRLSFDNLRDRRDNLRRLERLALIFDSGVGLPRQYGADSIEKQSFKLVAAHFRSLRSWIVLPQADTRRNLQGEFAATLNALASGEYHYLPRADHAPAVTRRSIAQWLLNVGQTLVLGALPLAAVLLLQRMNLEMDSKLETTLLITSMAWLCVSYITALDPMSAVKLTTTRELLTVINPRKES